MTAEAWVCLALAVVAGVTAAFVALRWRADRRALALASAAQASAIDANIAPPMAVAADASGSSARCTTCSPTASRS